MKSSSIEEKTATTSLVDRNSFDKIMDETNKKHT